MSKLLTIILIILTTGCSMTMQENIDGSCTLKGLGTGEGEIEDKCKIQKGIINWPDIGWRQ